MPSELQPWLVGAIFLVGAYLCGAIPFGLLAGWLRGVDIRTRGSGNIGATNAGRVLGKPFGALVFALDVLKGLVPVTACGYLLSRPDSPWGRPGVDATACLFWIAVAAACVLGHMFPVYLGFKGGKGVATSLGVLLGIYPYYTLAGLISLGLWVLVTLVTRYVSVGSMTAAVAFPIVFAAVASAHRQAWGAGRQLWPLHLFGIVVAALVVYRHRSNLGRLIEGVEPRIGASRDEGN